MATQLSDYAVRLANKRRATDEELEMYRPINHGRHVIRVGEAFYRLDREDEHDNLDANEKALAEIVNPYWDDAANAPDRDPQCQDVVDHRPDQTPIKDQLDRGTCVCFAALACLESILKRRQGTETLLSEQYANWLFMLQEGRNQCDDGTRTTLAARYLSRYGVCLDADAPYEDRTTVQTHCTPGPALSVQQGAKYGVGSFAIIDRIGLLGPSIANPDYLEALLCAGHDIVYGTHVAWGRADADGILDVILDSYGNPLRSRGGHAMLIVGFDKSGQKPYFIVKNSWGTGQEHGGYYYFSYDYMRAYAKYGYVVYNVREDMSDIPSDIP